MSFPSLRIRRALINPGWFKFVAARLPEETLVVQRKLIIQQCFNPARLPADSAAAVRESEAFRSGCEGFHIQLCKEISKCELIEVKWVPRVGTWAEPVKAQLKTFSLFVIIYLAVLTWLLLIWGNNSAPEYHRTLALYWISHVVRFSFGCGFSLCFCSIALFTLEQQNLTDLILF